MSWGGHSMFCSMFVFLCVWPGMIPNQRQLSIVVSDWEPYLFFFFHYDLWVVIFCVSPYRAVLVFIYFLLFSVFSYISLKYIMDTYHAVHWSDLSYSSSEEECDDFIAHFFDWDTVRGALTCLLNKSLSDCAEALRDLNPKTRNSIFIF